MGQPMNSATTPIFWDEGTETEQDDPEIVAWVWDKIEELRRDPELASIEHTEWLLKVQVYRGTIRIGYA